MRGKILAAILALATVATAQQIYQQQMSGWCGQTGATIMPVGSSWTIANPGTGNPRLVWLSSTPLPIISLSDRFHGVMMFGNIAQPWSDILGTCGCGWHVPNPFLSVLVQQQGSDLVASVPLPPAAIGIVYAQPYLFRLPWATAPPYATCQPWQGMAGPLTMVQVY